jgi:hypothetical protein
MTAITCWKIFGIGYVAMMVIMAAILPRRAGRGEGPTIGSARICNHSVPAAVERAGALREVFQSGCDRLQAIDHFFAIVEGALFQAQPVEPRHAVQEHGGLVEEFQECKFRE